ncbi:FCD domain-containing protein [Ruminococcaceae bacterium OttesenSCG-928-L11]|nr:FCD domain-containing protein [Ruminococcaceae bacterium OttesenSCG-928-L11]
MADYKRYGKLDTLEAILAYNGGRFTPEMLRSILGVRRAIQVDIAQLVATRRSEEDLETLRGLYQKIEESDDPVTLSELIFEFEHACSVMSGNMIYPLINYAFRASYTPLMLITCKQPFRDERIRWVRKLLGFIEQKRPEEAVRCIEDGNIWCMEAIGQSYSPEERYFT